LDTNLLNAKSAVFMQKSALPFVADMKGKPWIAGEKTIYKQIFNIQKPKTVIESHF